MSVTFRNTEIITSRPPAWAEGIVSETNDETDQKLSKPEQAEIHNMLIKKNWKPKNISIKWNNLLQIWQWSARLEKVV